MLESKFLQNKYFQIFLIIIFSFLHGCLYFYPDWTQNLIQEEFTTYFSYHQGSYYANNDEIVYGPSIRRIFDFFDYGFLNLKNPTSLTPLSSYNYQIVPYIFAGFLSYILGGVENFFYIKNFIFPAFGLLLSFILLKVLFKSFFLSLFGAILFYNPYFAVVDLLKYFSFDSSLWIEQKALDLLATKYPSQQFSIIFYFLGLISIFKILENKNYKYLLILSITISAYSYLFTFIALGLMTFLLFIYALTFDYNYKKEFFFAGLISFLLSLPVILLSYFQDFRPDLLMTFALTKSQYFDPTNYAIKSIIIGIACFFITKFYDKSYHNLSAIIIVQLIPLTFFGYVCYYVFIVPEPQHFNVNYHFSKILFILMVVKLVMNAKIKIFSKTIKNFVFIMFCLTSLSLYANSLIWQTKTAELKTDMKSSEKKKLLNWMSVNTPKKSTVLTLDPLLFNTIPTLTGRYNYIPSLKTLSPTSIEAPVTALRNTKKILGLNDEFDNFLNSSCKNYTKSNLVGLCESIFYDYFRLDEGSFSYLMRSKKLPENLIVPEKNRQGKHIIFTQILLKDNKTENSFSLPEYIIVGPVVEEFGNKENYLKLYEKIFFTENYKIFKTLN